MQKHGFIVDVGNGLLRHGEATIPLQHPQDIGECAAVLRTRIGVDSGSDVEDLRRAQLADDDIAPVMNWLAKGKRPTWRDIAHTSRATRAYWALWKSLLLEDGVLTRKWESQDGKTWNMQLVLPRSRVEGVLVKLHSSASGAHLEKSKMLEMIRKKFFWLRCRDDVGNWIRQCKECAAAKRSSMKRKRRAKRCCSKSPEGRVDAEDGIGRQEDSSRRLGSSVAIESDRVKARHETRGNLPCYKEGDLVWLCSPRRRGDKSPGLRPKRNGPYTIATRISDVVYRIRKSSRSKLKVVHYDRLAPYVQPNNNE